MKQNVQAQILPAEETDRTKVKNVKKAATFSAALSATRPRTAMCVRRGSHHRWDVMLETFTGDRWSSAKTTTTSCTDDVFFCYSNIYTTEIMWSNTSQATSASGLSDRSWCVLAVVDPPECILKPSLKSL